MLITKINFQMRGCKEVDRYKLTLDLEVRHPRCVVE